MKLYLLQESIVRRLQIEDQPLMSKDLLLGGAASHWTIREKYLEPFVDVILESRELLNEMTGEDVGSRETEKRKALWARIEEKHRINSHLIIHSPTSEGVSEVSERANK